MAMWSELKRLLHDLAVGDDGQDLVEYALLTASIGLVATATWPAIEVAIGAAYESLDTATQDLWEVKDPL